MIYSASSNCISYGMRIFKYTTPERFSIRIVCGAHAFRQIFNVSVPHKDDENNLNANIDVAPAISSENRRNINYTYSWPPIKILFMSTTRLSTILNDFSISSNSMTFATWILRRIHYVANTIHTLLRSSRQIGRDAVTRWLSTIHKDCAWLWCRQRCWSSFHQHQYQFGTITAPTRTSQHPRHTKADPVHVELKSFAAAVTAFYSYLCAGSWLAGSCGCWWCRCLWWFAGEIVRQRLRRWTLSAKGTSSSHMQMWTF